VGPVGLAPASSGTLRQPVPHSIEAARLAPPAAATPADALPSRRTRMWSWIKRVVFRRDVPPPVSMLVGAIAAQDTTPIKQRYSLYTPELNLMAETQTTTAANLAIAYEYAWFDGEPLAQIETGTSSTHWYFNDHLGAPVLTTSATGAIDWRVEREPYGQRYLRAGADRHQPLGLPGQEVGSEAIERDYNIFRWYRPAWSRYLEADPAAIRSTLEPRFDYASGSPIGNVDRVGLIATVGTGCIGGCPAGFSSSRSHRLARAFADVCRDAAATIKWPGVARCIQQECKRLTTIRCSDPGRCRAPIDRGWSDTGSDSSIGICPGADDGTPSNCTHKHYIIHEMMHKCFGEVTSNVESIWDAEIDRYAKAGGPCH
jgi:RHS repeat-associated protein